MWDTDPWWRIYHRGEHTPNDTCFRQYGPLHRFDQHSPAIPPEVDPAGRSVLYLGRTLAASACEVFGEAMTAQLCPNWRVSQITPTRPIHVFDLHASGAALSIGALPALANGHEPRLLTQQWARVIYEDQPVTTGTVEGIRYDTAYDNDRSLVLWDCADAVTLARGQHGALLDRRLIDAPIYEQLWAQLPPRHITITTVSTDQCQACARG